MLACTTIVRATLLVFSAAHRRLVRQPGGELGEPARIAQRRAVAEAGQARAQCSEPARGLAVADRVRREDRRRLVQAGKTGSDVDVVEHVPEDQDPVGLAPVGEVSARVSGALQDGEAADLVTLHQRPGDR